MIGRYRKGYMAERSLVHELYNMGYAVIRAPHSGSINIASPDIVAIKNGKVIVIECKAHKKGFKVDETQLKELQEWENRAGARAYIAWKISRKGWHFLKLADVIANNGNVGFKFLEGRVINIDDICN
ncbi:MAG: Holliday junction resolvase Hjc [Candidatus Aenigmatarchaeota archaeon]